MYGDQSEEFIGGYEVLKVSNKQILQTDLYTFPYRISWEKQIKDQRFFSSWSFD